MSLRNVPRFTRDNATSSLKVLGWSVGSAVAATVLVWLADLDVSEQYLFIVPIINTSLYAIKEWFDKQV